MFRSLAVLACSLTLGAGVRTHAAAQGPPPAPSLEANSNDSVLADLAARRRAEIDAAIKARDWPRAETLLVAEIDRTPKPVDLLKELAGVFMNDRKPLNAAIAIKKAEKFGALDAPTRLQLALAYIAMRRGDWARPELDRLAAAEPLNTMYAYWLARLDYDSGRYDAAIARLRVVVQREPTFIRAYDNLGSLLRGAEPARRGRPSGTAKRSAATRETGEQWPWPFLNLGILLKQRGEIQEAETLFREALEADPAFAPALYHLGTVLEHNERTDDAVQMLRRAAAADPDVRRAILRALPHLPTQRPHSGGRRGARHVPATAPTR